MFCPKCGKELNPGVKFCSGCGAPVSEPIVEEAPYERSTIETVDPVSDKPVFIPEPVKTSNNKKFITIGILVAMIAVLVLGFLKYQDLEKGIEGKWKVVSTTFTDEIPDDAFVEVYGNKVKLIDGDDVDEYTLAENEFNMNGANCTLSVKNGQLIMSASFQSVSVEYYMERTELMSFYIKGLLLYIVAFAILLIALIICAVFKKNPKNAVPAGTYSGTTGSLPVFTDTVEETAEMPVAESTPVAPVAEPSVETVNYESVITPLELVNEEPATENAVETPKYDIDTYNTVAEFEKASEPFAPVEDTAAESYPTSPAVEEKKDSDNEWFTTAGDL